MARALITGITGQDGLYLGEFLAAKGYEVFGLVSRLDDAKRASVGGVIPTARLIEGDLTDPTTLTAALETAEPDEVYNLGGISFVGGSWENAGQVADITGKGALNMLDTTRRWAGDDLERVRFLQASSADMFGQAEQSPQNEETPFAPRSPYAVAKIFGHYMTMTYREAHGMHASSAILYNHESPRRGEQFVTRKITKAVARISLGLDESVALGDLDARRDWGFAGDYVRAMWLMLQQDAPGDYVIATGVAHSVREFVTAAFAAVGIDDWSSLVTQDARFMRPVAVNRLLGDASKARRELGWEPTMAFEELVATMVENDLAEQRALLG